MKGAQIDFNLLFPGGTVPMGGKQIEVVELDAEEFTIITDQEKELIPKVGEENIANLNIENQLKFTPYISSTIVVGTRRKNLTHLIIRRQRQSDQIC
jgi:long-chain acyl-CoA synthetase